MQDKHSLLSSVSLTKGTQPLLNACYHQLQYIEEW